MAFDFEDDTASRRLALWIDLHLYRRLKLLYRMLLRKESDK